METLDQNLTLNHLLDQAENLPHALIVPALGLAETVDQAGLRNRLRSLPYKQFLKTRYWRAVALAVKDRAGQRCQCCNSTLFLQAHHRSYEHHGEEHRFMIDLTCLCDKCHDKFHEPKATPSAPATVVKIVYRDRPAISTYRSPAFANGVEHTLLADELTMLTGIDRSRLENWKTRRLRKAIARARYKSAHPRTPGVPRAVPYSPETIEAMMPAGTGPVVLTKKLIEQCRTNGAFTTAACMALGVQDKMAGWPKRLQGKEITREQYRAALVGRAIYAKSTR